jgi:hypothetical protein
MISKPVHQLKLSDLQALIGNVRESKTLEFKREMPAGTADEKIRFLAAVSALANTAGGELLIGLETAQGVPTGVPGIALSNPDGEKLRLEQILASQLEPRLPRIDMEAIDCSGGRYVLIIRVARSWIAPHRVTANDKFYGRNSGGNYPLDVSELRSAFVLSESAAERIRAFRNDRLVKISAGETPVPLDPGGKAVLHVVPVPSFVDNRLMDIATAAIGGTHMPLPLGGMSGANRSSVNLDGLVNYTDKIVRMRQSYAQFFRSGAIEGVGELSRRDEDGYPYFVGPEFTQKIVFAVRQYLDVLRSYDAGLPVYVFLSLCDVAQCFYRNAPEGFWVDNGPLGRDFVALPEIYVESFDIDVPTIMRPAFNMLWNAFGLLQCDMYNQQGQWKGSN